MGWQEINLARVNFDSLGSPGSGGAGSGSNGDVGEKTKKKSHIRKYRCPVCGCSVRASKELSIACFDCNARMLLDTPPEELPD